VVQRATDGGLLIRADDAAFERDLASPARKILITMRTSKATRAVSDSRGRFEKRRTAALQISASNERLCLRLQW